MAMDMRKKHRGGLEWVLPPGIRSVRVVDGAKPNEKYRLSRTKRKCGLMLAKDNPTGGLDLGSGW